MKQDEVVTYNELNFPSFVLSLQLWQSGVLKKWKQEDDWEMWWMADKLDKEPALVQLSCLAEDYLAGLVFYFFAVPCPSLGEMMERLANRGWFLERGVLSWRVKSPFGNCIANSDTPPNAAANGLMEVEK